MKFHEPRNLALLNALIITGIYIFLFSLSFLLMNSGVFNHFFSYLIIFFNFLLLFISVYLIFRYTIDHFIYSKIRLIYKSIHSFKLGKKEKPVIFPKHDIIENVQAEVDNWEDEKQKEIEQLKRLEQYRRDFIGNVSHELKTPLFNIQGYVSTLLDGGLEDPTINREYLRRSEKSIERLVKIIESLDEISQLESGHIRLNISRFNLVALTQEVVEMLDMKANKHNIRITINEPEKHIFVSADKEKIRQVLTNILDNSIRYGKEGNGQAKITFFDMDENILTEITDNGIGIDSLDLVRVFERFYRTDRGRAITRKGKGLGLAIVKHIVEAHQQTIQVRSTIGVGTTFGFTLKKS